MGTDAMVCVLSEVRVPEPSLECRILGPSLLLLLKLVYLGSILFPLWIRVRVLWVIARILVFFLHHSLTLVTVYLV